MKRRLTTDHTDGTDKRHFSFRIRVIGVIRGLVSAFLLLPSLCLGYGNLQFKDASGTNIVNSLWDERQYNSAAFPNGIPWLLNTNGLTKSTLSNVPPSQIQGIVSNACATWQAVPQAKIQFTFSGITTNKPSGTSTNSLPPNPALDGDNVIAFGNLSSGVLGITYSFVLNDQFTFASTNNSFGGTDSNPDIPEGTYPAGTILDADILISSNANWSVTGERRKYDLQGVLVHEIGHFIGLSHSCVRETYLSTATMFPFAASNPEGLEQRTLSQDDIAGVSSYYPSAAFSNDFGSIAGTVTKSGVPFLGAHVWAVKTNDRSTIIGAYTASNGTYLLQGLLPGAHTLRVEPIYVDGSSINSVLEPTENPAIVDFQAQFYGGVAVESSSVSVTVSAGSNTNGYNFALIDGGGADPFEPDNTIAQAHLLVANSAREIHHFYPDSDVDWFRFSATSGTVYRISTSNIILKHRFGSRTLQSDTFLSLYDADGTTLLYRNDNLALANDRLESWILFQCTRDGQYYVTVRDATPRNANDQYVGAGSNYDIQIAAVTPAEYYVSASGGSDITGDGSKTSSWATVQHAIDTAQGTYEIPVFIKVAEGTYQENILCDSFESIFGGYEAATWSRDIAVHQSILDGRQLGSVVQGANAMTIDGFTITNGLAAQGGGIYCPYGYSPGIVSNTITGNKATSVAGGILLNLLSDTCVLGNKISSNTGNTSGGMQANDTSAYIAHNIFRQNAAGLQGGAMSVRSSLEVPAAVENNLFLGNGAATVGGALLTDYNVFIVGNVFVANHTDDTTFGKGGAIYVSYSGFISNNVFCANTSSREGGAVHAYSSASVIAQNIFAANSARTVGGAVRVENLNYPNLRGNVFVGNKAQSGAGIYHDAFGGDVLNNSVVYNQTNGITLAALGGGAAPTYRNNIIFGNYGYGLYEQVGSCFFQYNNILGNTLGDYYDLNTSNTYSTAAQINTLVANPGGAVSNNVDWPPNFMPAPFGSASSIAYSSNTYQSVLSDSSTAFVPGALAGLTINPNTNQYLHFYIVTNTTSTITTWGDMTTVATAPSPYQVFDYHLAGDSQNINAGTNLSAFVSSDIDGELRPVGAGFDIGADEFLDSDGDMLADDSERRYGLNPNNPDFDSDGMPDGWELFYRDPFVAGNGNVDPDNDGMTDLQESIAFTDPDDSASSLRILSIAYQTNNTVNLLWTSIPNKRYAVFATTNLTLGAYVPTGGTNTANNFTTSFTDPATNTPAKLYKVRVLP